MGVVCHGGTRRARPTDPEEICLFLPSLVNRGAKSAFAFS